MVRSYFSKGRLRNEFGLSMVEMLVVVAIVGVTSMAIMSLMDNLNKQMTVVRVKTDAESTLMGIVSALKTEDACKYTLVKSFVDMTTAGPKALTHVAYYDSGGNKTADVLPTSAWDPATGVPGNPRLSISSIMLTKPGDPAQPPMPVPGGTNLYAADMIVTFAQTGAIALKPYLVPGLQLQTNAAGTTVLRCKLGMKQLCLTGYEQYGGGGAYSTGIASTDPLFAGTFGDVFAQYNGGGYWGLQCQPGWKMTGCASTGLRDVTSTTSLNAQNNGCQAIMAAGAGGASRVYLSCCSE